MISRDGVVTWEDVLRTYHLMTPWQYRRLRWAPLDVLIKIGLKVGIVAQMDQALLHVDGYDAGECEPLWR
jgi:hypothetical protein